MPKPAALIVVRRRRGNPNWGRPLSPMRVLPTEFERQTRSLRLTPKKYASSVELRRWCERNKNHHFIPEWLLKLWNISVNSDIGTAA